MNRTSTRFYQSSWILRLGVLMALACVGTAAYAAIASGAFSTAHSSQVQVTKVVLTKPTASAGELLLASIAVNGGSSANITAPTGWAQVIRTDNDVNVSLITYSKIAGASEPSSYTWSIDGQTTAEGGIVAYSGVDSASPVDASSGNVGFSLAATTTALITSSPDEQIVAIFATDIGKAADAGNYFGVSTGMAEKYDVTNKPFGPSMALDDALQTVAGTVASKSATITGNKSRNWVAHAIALRPIAVSHGISFDNALLVSYAPPTTLNYTVGALPNRALLVCELTLNDTAVAPLYDGTPLTFLGKTSYRGSGYYGIAAYLMLNPPSGTHGLELRSSSGNIAALIGSYAGVRQTAQPDAQHMKEYEVETNLTDTVTTTTADDWLVECEVDSGPGVPSSYNSSGTLRVSDFQVGGFLGDTNAGVPVGNNDFTVSVNGTQPPAIAHDILIGLSPAP